jgi:hypothetical protein
MSRGGSIVRRLAALAVLVCLARPAAVKAGAPPLVLVVEGYDEGAAERLRAALERELGRPVVRQGVAPEGEGSVTVGRKAGHEVEIAYVTPDGRRLVRGLRVQDDEARAEREIALLAGNLARDESAALLAGLPGPDEAAAPPAGVKPPAGAGKAFSCNDRRGPEIFVGADVAPFVGVSTLPAGREAARVFSANLFGGLSRGTVAAEGAGFVNVDAEFVCGFQFAGLANFVGGSLRGLQLAGLANAALGPAEGAQVSGFVNVGWRDVSGLQLTGGANAAFGTVRGAQVGGLASFAGGGVEGAQVSGFANLSWGPVSGAQVSLVNLARGPVSGAQTGFINAASGRVRGVQIGFINYAESADFALGFINVYSKGRTHLDAWFAPEVGITSLAIKHGGAHFHYLYGLSMRIVDGTPWSVFGLGAHLPLRRSWFVDVDVISYSQLGLQDIERRQGRGINQARAVLGHPIAQNLSLYGGVTANVALSGFDKEPPMYSFYKETPNGEDSAVVTVWPGLVLGLQAF